MYLSIREWWRIISSKTRVKGSIAAGPSVSKATFDRKTKEKKPMEYSRKSPICVITGMEHSGTTLASQLLNAHPRIASGVECGLLLSNIKDFDKVHPFWDWLLAENWGWALTEEDRETLLLAEDFEEAYQILNCCKGRGNTNSELRKIFAESDLIYDKTPRYIYELRKVMRKIDRPFVVTVKSPLEAYTSYQKRGMKLRGFIAAYEKALVETSLAAGEYPNRILVLAYKSLVTDPAASMKRLQRFIGLNDGSVLSLANYNSRFGRLVESTNTFRNDTIEYLPPDPLSNQREISAIASLQDRLSEQLRIVTELSRET